MLAGTNFVLHAAGWMEGGLSASYEKFVMDFDQLGAMHVLAKGVDLSDNGQGMEAFHQVEPGGHFLGCAAYAGQFRDRLLSLDLADNNSVEQWREEGSKDAATRANALWKSMLADYEAARARPGEGRSDPRLYRAAQGVDAGRDLLMGARAFRRSAPAPTTTLRVVPLPRRFAAGRIAGARPSRLAYPPSRSGGATVWVVKPWH